MDGVAKILLSDWVRGKIPFFVPPPEHPDELNKAEEARRRKEEAKGKSRAVDEQEERLHAIGVRQNLGSITQKNTFIGEDVRPIEEEDEEVIEEDEDEEDEGGEDDESEEGDELGWGDVFPEDAPRRKQSDDDMSVDESAEEEDQVEGRLSTTFSEATVEPSPQMWMTFVPTRTRTLQSKRSLA